MPPRTWRPSGAWSSPTRPGRVRGCAALGDRGLLDDPLGGRRRAGRAGRAGTGPGRDPDRRWCAGGGGGAALPAAGVEPRPVIMGVEPTRAACMTASIEAGEPVQIPGPHDSIMSGLNCGVPSPLAWPIVSRGIDLFVAIEDERARQAMRDLAASGVVAGECGAAGLAGLQTLARWAGCRRARSGRSSSPARARPTARPTSASSGDCRVADLLAGGLGARISPPNKNQCECLRILATARDEAMLCHRKSEALAKIVRSQASRSSPASPATPNNFLVNTRAHTRDYRWQDHGECVAPFPKTPGPRLTLSYPSPKVSPRSRRVQGEEA